MDPPYFMYEMLELSWTYLNPMAASERVDVSADLEDVTSVTFVSKPVGPVVAGDQFRHGLAMV